MTALRKWVVKHSETGSLREFLTLAGIAPTSSIDAGRVFVNGTRVQGRDIEVSEGELVELRTGRAEGLRCAIVGTRGGLLAVAKQAGIPMEPDRRGSEHCVIDQVSELLEVPRGSLHAPSRLDLGVSGVVVIARSHSANEHLEEERRAGRFHKSYAGISGATPSPASGTWTAPIPGRSPRDRCRPAITKYRATAIAGATMSVGRTRQALVPTLLEMVAVTGRFHQLRRHASGASCPLLGDERYGGARQIANSSGRVVSVPRVMLHAFKAELLDMSGEPWTVEVPLPCDFSSLWSALGGQNALTLPRE